MLDSSLAVLLGFRVENGLLHTILTVLSVSSLDPLLQVVQPTLPSLLFPLEVFLHVAGVGQSTSPLGLLLLVVILLALGVRRPTLLHRFRVGTPVLLLVVLTVSYPRIGHGICTIRILYYIDSINRLFNNH